MLWRDWVLGRALVPTAADTGWHLLGCCPIWSSDTSGKGLCGTWAHSWPRLSASFCSDVWVPDVAPALHWNTWLPRETTQPFHLLYSMLDAGNPESLPSSTQERAQESLCSRIPNNVEFLLPLGPPILEFSLGRGTCQGWRTLLKCPTWLSSFGLLFNCLLPPNLKFCLVFGIWKFRLWSANK